MVDLRELPPHCEKCGGLLKPDFVFFGEPIPEPARTRSFLEAERSDALLVIGTTGEVMPACMVPFSAKRQGATIIEVNVDESSFTSEITDVFLQGKASMVMETLLETLKAE
jgi:NAD-dependent deacetylase